MPYTWKKKWRRYYRRYWRTYKGKFKNKFNMNYYNYVCNVQTYLKPSKRNFHSAEEFNYIFELSDTPYMNFVDMLDSAKGFQNFKTLFQQFKVRGYSLKIIPDQNNIKNVEMTSHNLPIINYTNTYTYNADVGHFNVPNRTNTKDSNYAVLCKPLETTYKYHSLRGAYGIWQNIKVPAAQLTEPYTYGTLYANTYLDADDMNLDHYPWFIVEVKLYVTLKNIDV